MTFSLRSHANCVYDTRYHLVFSTPGRKKVLTRHILSHLEDLIIERVNFWRGELVSWQGHSDHVRIELLLPPHVSVAAFAGALKTGTSRRLRNTHASLKRHDQLWANHYLVLTTGGHAAEDTIKAYLDDSKTEALKASGEITINLPFSLLSSKARRLLNQDPKAAQLAMIAAIEAAATNG